MTRTNSSTRSIILPRFLQGVVLFCLLGGLFISPVGIRTGQSARPASASEVIQEVNALRAANGLPAYKVNSALMGAAQAQSEYQASQGSASHTGKGGSSVKGRAMAYGYGGGADVSVSENIATGPDLTASQAVGIWQGDGLHLSTMLNTSYTDVGAGMATSGDQVFYTLVAGYVSGEPGSAPAASGNNASGNNTGEGQAAAAAQPIQLSTPKPDGTIIHEVGDGQALWNIAAAYKISLNDLLGLNGLTESSMIFPGEKLVIYRGNGTPRPQETITTTVELTGTATVSGTVTAAGPTNTSTPRPTATSRPTRTPMLETPTPVIVVLELDAPTERPTARATEGAVTAAKMGLPKVDLPKIELPGEDPMLLIVGGLVGLGVVLLVVGVMMGRNR